MAIIKTIPIHSMQGTGNCKRYVENPEKTTLTKKKAQIAVSTTSELEGLFSYTGNPEKTAYETENRLLVSGHNCTPETALFSFDAARENYLGNLKVSDGYIRGKRKDGTQKQAIDAIHLIMSFPADKTLEAPLVHKIGLEFCQRAIPDFQATVSTHMNTEHLHNHIVICAYRNDGRGKFHDNLATRKYLRQLSDELSLKYDLPIILDKEQEHGAGKNWYEWDKERRNESWKARMRGDIDRIRYLAESFEDFTERMKKADYDLRITEKTITFTDSVDKTLKIRGAKLGPEYTKTSLEDYYRKRERKYQTHNQEKQTENIYISPYARNGRRRSELELLLLRAIKILRRLRDSLQIEETMEKLPEKSPSREMRQKLKQMEQSLYYARFMGIETWQELKEQLKETGSELSHTKKEFQYIEKNRNALQAVNTLLDEAGRLQNACKQAGVEIRLEDLHLKTYTEREIHTHRAEIMPMTAAQRRELFLCMEKSSEWRLKYKFRELTYNEGAEAIAFLSGKSTERPACLYRPGEQEANRRTQEKIELSEQQENRLFEEYLASLPISIQQTVYELRNTLDKLQSIGIDVRDAEKLSEIGIRTKENTAAYIEMKKRLGELSHDYAMLARLRDGLTLAESRDLINEILYIDKEVKIKKKQKKEIDLSESISLDS